VIVGWWVFGTGVGVREGLVWRSCDETAVGARESRRVTNELTIMIVAIK